MKLCFSRFRPCCLFLLLYIVLIISYGFYSYYSNKAEILRNIDENLLLIASVVKNTLDVDFHDQAVNKNAISKIQDSNNVIALSDYAERMNVAAVYTLIKQNEKVYYTASSKSEEEMKNGIETPYFLSYDEAPPDVITAFDKSDPTYFSESNKWDCIRKVLIPEYSPQGKLYLTGVDIDTIQTENKIRKHLWFSIGISAIFIALTIPFIFLFKKSEQEHIEEFESLKELLHQKSMHRTTRIEKKINEYIKRK